MVAEGLMSINILKFAEIKNISADTGLYQRTASRDELLSLIGTVSGVSVASLRYLAFEADLGYSVYCKDGSITAVNGYDYFCSVTCSIQTQPDAPWLDVPVIQNGGTFTIDFNRTFPDMAQLIYKIRFVYINKSVSTSTLLSAQLSTVDYPITYDYVKFAVAASSYGNSPIAISNYAVQGTSRNIRVTPAYSGNFALDQMLLLTASGKSDPDKYSINSGINIPEQIPWEAGCFINTMVSGNYLTLTGTNTSGTWLSPAIYITDPNYVTMYVYTEDAGHDAGVEKDWLNINNVLQARGSNETPLPNFLINSWTPRLYTYTGYTTDLPEHIRRPMNPTLQDVYPEDNEYWVIDMENMGCARALLVTPCPYMYGRSDRVYMKGDGTIIAQSPLDRWQISQRDYWTGYPYKVFGSINNWWNAGSFFGLLGDGIGYCMIDTGIQPHHQQMTFATMTDDSNWNSGKSYEDQAKNMLPLKGHNLMGGLGLCQDPVLFDYIGSTTLPKPQHPNEWIVLWAEMYPCDPGAEKYMCIYLFNIRNWWVSEKKLIGIYGIGLGPSDEGYAICNCTDADDHEGGFWLHVGYSTNIIERWRGDGYLINSYSVQRSYSFIKESCIPGELWAVRNDGIFYYKEDQTNGLLTVLFNVQDPSFQYIQGGDVDNDGNLWVVDRDTSTVYRINLSKRAIDYTNHVPYAMGVWPHPTDGSAFIYVGFNPGTYSPVIKRVRVDDAYQYEELVSVVPTMPLSDAGGLQFTGKLSATYISPGVNDPMWGASDDMTLEWEDYVNASMGLPDGRYKQFKLTFRRTASSIAPPRVSKIRIPEPLILENVPFGDNRNVYINPHLRYDKNVGHFTTQLLTWWPHGE
jgi:hypothetical protein